MKKVLVIGGGLSGLSAAVYLSHNKFDVTLIEATHKLGGKAYSFIEEKFETEIDNGQHILLGCYWETLKFLKIISAISTINIQEKFLLNYISENIKISTLKTFNYFYPANLLIGLISFPLFSVKEKFYLLKFLLKIRFIDSEDLSNISVKEWLIKENQPKKVNSLFWEVISIGALNCSIEVASAKVFCDILKQIFWSNENAFKVILPRISLNQTFINPAETFLRKNNAKLFTSEKCVDISINNNKIEKIKTNRRELSNFNYYLIAIPFYKLKSFSVLELDAININYSPIVNVYIWLRNNPLKESFYALEESIIHWIFNKGRFINITISNAINLISKSKDEISNITLNELNKFIPGILEEVENIVVIKEKKATFIPSNEIINKRLSAKTEIENLFLAGDWTDTKLPSTIEGAVKSGRIAAEEIIKDYFNKNELNEQ